LVQQPGDHAGGGRLAAGAGDADADFGGVEELGQQFGPLHVARADALGGDDVTDSVFNGGRADEDLVGAGEARAVLREEGDALGFQVLELGAEAALVERAVGAGYVHAFAAQDERQRQHAGAADAAEEIGFCLTHDARL